VREKQQLDAKCKELIAKAEQIKRSKSWQPACPENRDASNLEEPASTRKLSTREEIILLEGAKLNGFLFPPWVAAPDPEEFELDNGKKIFMCVRDRRSNARLTVQGGFILTRLEISRI
jgi:hypothetical protein